MPTETLAAPALAVAGVAGQYLTFTLSGEEYAIEILKVQEIKGRTAITPLPHTPPHVKGVMNLRGTVVPVLDLRLRFGLEATPWDKFSVIVVVKVGSRTVGLVVDAVSDVLDISAEDVGPAPELGEGISTAYLTGMARAGEKLIVLLDIDRVVGVDALAGATPAAA